MNSANSNQFPIQTENKIAAVNRIIVSHKKAVTFNNASD